MNETIVPSYGETAARFDVGDRVWSAVFGICMLVEARAYAAGCWAYCLVDPIDPEGEVYTAGLSSQLRQDRNSDWHRDHEVWAKNPDEEPFNLFDK